jgi:hypothetical protein
MLRWLFIGMIALGLSGCESDADFWPQNVVDNAWPFADSATVAAAPQDADKHCAAVAYARAADAKANGFDDDMRDEVYNGTYANCAAWDKVHPTQGS